MSKTALELVDEWIKDADKFVGTDELKLIEKVIKKEQATGKMKKELTDLCNCIHARCENAYVNMIELARCDEALGFDAKVDLGKFGRDELIAHCAVAEKLGRHRALRQICNEIREIIQQEGKTHGGWE